MHRTSWKYIINKKFAKQIYKIIFIKITITKYWYVIVQLILYQIRERKKKIEREKAKKWKESYNIIHVPCTCHVISLIQFARAVTVRDWPNGTFFSGFSVLSLTPFHHPKVSELIPGAYSSRILLEWQVTLEKKSYKCVAWAKITRGKCSWTFTQSSDIAHKRSREIIENFSKYPAIAWKPSLLSRHISGIKITMRLIIWNTTKIKNDRERSLSSYTVFDVRSYHDLTVRRMLTRQIEIDFSRFGLPPSPEIAFGKAH